MEQSSTVTPHTERIFRRLGENPVKADAKFHSGALYLNALC